MSLVMPRSEWPGFDQAMWDDLCRVAGPLDDPGPLAKLRATSLHTLEVRYGRWLQWLTNTEPHALREEPGERASLIRLQAWLEDLAHTAPMTRLMFVEAVLRIVQAAAPEHDWTKHQRLRAALKRDAGRGDPKRKAGRILSSQVLLEAGLRYATQTSTGTRLQCLLRQRDGTMIALLALLPMRRRSFSELALGDSVHAMPDRIILSLSEEMMKSGGFWEVEVPRPVDGLLRHYIEAVRPALLARGGQRHNQLWVGKKGERMREGTVGSLIAGKTLALTGKRIPPHFFRDAAATTLARMAPQAARLIRPVLAHAGFRTAERHYIHARTIEAGRDYAALVNRLKGAH